MKISTVILLLLGSLFSLHAQESSPLQMPQGPLLNRVSPPSEWVITTQAPPPPEGASKSVGGPGAAANQVKPTLTTVIKESNIVYEKTINESGVAIETWRASGLAITGANAKEWNIWSGGVNTFSVTDYSKADFAGFDWISLDNFSGRRSVMGKKCLIFKSKIITMDPQQLQMEKSAVTTVENPNPSDDRFKVEVEADVDDVTRLPVMLSYKTTNGMVTRSYTFQAPTVPLSVPPEVKKLLDKYIENLKRISVRSAPI